MPLATSHKRRIQSLDSQDQRHMDINWDDVVCPICLEFPHNGVLLQCSSHDKGCRPFMCDTDRTHSNCLNRFKTAYGVPATTVRQSSSTSNGTYREITRGIPSNPSKSPICPLCRGVVSGWVIIDAARGHLDSKKRCCEERNCSFVGNYAELLEHANLSHPNACPSEIDPARQLDWENFQQSSEIIDVLSTIHSEVPHGVVLGDYVIEYGDDSGDEYEDFPGDEGNWWTSRILYQVFDNFSASRNRRRSRSRELRRDQQGSSYNASNVDEGSTSSLDFGEHQFDDTDNEFIAMGSSCGNSASSSRSSSRSPEYLENISPLAMRLGTSHKFDEGSTSSLDFGEHQFDDTDNEFIAMGSSGGNSASSSRSSSRSYRRRLSGFHDPQKRFLWRQL